MNRSLRLPIDIQIICHPNQSVLRLQFHRGALHDWCLGLCLLKEGLIEAFTVVEEGATGKRVRFLVGSGHDARSRIALDERSSDVVLTRNALDYLHRFFLKYYRDGVAEVDHLDLEGVDDKTGKEEIYVTFQAPESRVPMTPEEAKRRIERWS